MARNCLLDDAAGRVSDVESKEVIVGFKQSSLAKDQLTIVGKTT